MAPSDGQRAEQLKSLVTYELFYAQNYDVFSNSWAVHM